MNTNDIPETLKQSIIRAVKDLFLLTAITALMALMTRGQKVEPYWIIIGGMSFKVIYYLAFTIEKIFEVDSERIFNLLLIMFLCVFLIVLSFSLDYYFLYFHYNDCFQYQDSNLFENLFNFFYFSTVTFFTIGYGDILPTCIPAKLVVITQSFTYLWVIGFIIANLDKFKKNPS